MANFSSDNTTLLTAALEGLELQKQRIETQIAQVRSALGKKVVRVAAASAISNLSGPKRNLSEAARKRIAAAQKRRWAEYRKKKASGG